jgi:LmbE family N-acetylglucosaminyl deacetylase
MRRNINRLTAFALLLAFIATGLPLTNAQVRPVYDWGAGGLGMKLKRLPTIASAMHTAAHPDDEDSALMARLARGDHARVSYLSLTRGEGGQNVIGPELFEPLGIIRTEELLQARRLDGGDQHFTRFMEYGFSKSRAEAARIWGEKEVLGDMVRSIRLYRPLVVISRFSGTPADGHGQHQLAGYLTPIAYKAAADPNQFPEHMAEGLRPWQPLKLYMGQGMGANSTIQPTLIVPTGDHCHLIGRSYFEIAMEGRSQHKSQEMGSLELRGKQQSGLRLLEKEFKSDSDDSIFDGIDVSIVGIAKIAKDDTPALKEKLAELQMIADSAVSQFNAYDPIKLIPVLAKGVRVAREASLTTRNPEVKFFLEHKINDFQEALQAAAGIVVDALSDSETIVPGDSVGVAVRVFAPDSAGIKVLGTEIKHGNGWKAEKTAAPSPGPTQGFRLRNEVAVNADFFTLSAPETARPTQPYWLEAPRSEFTFSWEGAGDAKNMPFQGPIASASVKIRVGGEEITVNKGIEYRFADDIRGELRRELNVVPLVTNSLESTLAIVRNSAGTTTQRVTVSITNNAPRQVAGSAKLDLPSGWVSIPATRSFNLSGRGEKTAVTFDVRIPGRTAVGAYTIGAKSVVDGKEYGLTMQEVAYPHMQTHRMYRASNVDVKVVNLSVANVKVGYIMGTGDRVPEAIRLLGLPVTMLSEKDLTTGDLSRYDVIVVGIRASQVRRDFVANNGRLLDYVRNGGTMIVQYQQHEYARENMLPFPAKMEGVVRGTQRISNLRAVDETAPVTILQPRHPVFNFPNKIGKADFDNWVQERHLYSLSDLGPQWTPLLESHDEGEEDIPGGMVYAKIGRGHYVYNAYSFFRQLPTGNPGAYRIFANLLSLPKTGNK